MQKHKGNMLEVVGFLVPCVRQSFFESTARVRLFDNDLDGTLFDEPVDQSGRDPEGPFLSSLIDGALEIFGGNSKGKLIEGIGSFRLRAGRRWWAHVSIWGPDALARVF